jgi:hypothetical protein
VLHTIKESGDGVGPLAPWAPTVRRPMPRGFSAAAWQRFSYLSLLVLFLPRSGVEVRAAGEPKLALPELTKRWAASRVYHTSPDRMSRRDAAEAAVTAREINEANLDLAKAKSNRAQLINRFGAAAGNMRADARNYTLAAALTAGGLPALVVGIEGTSISRNTLWLLPAIVLTVIITGLSLIGIRKTAHATRLAADFRGVTTKDLPPWTAVSAPESRR